MILHMLIYLDKQNRRESQQAALGDLGARVAGVGAESSPARQPTPARQLPSYSGGSSSADVRSKLSSPPGKKHVVMLRFSA
jgi:hypothetical protein